MSMWDIGERGFLPEKDPATYIKCHDSVSSSYVMFLENLSFGLPWHLEHRSVREELVSELRSAPISSIDFFDKLDEQNLERVMMLFSYFASAYVYATHEKSATRIPEEIACPLVMVANKVNRPPILSYASYCLSNWKRKDPNKAVELGNIELLQNFTANHGRRDENWFILIHVDIENKAAIAMKGIKDSFEAIKTNNLDGASDSLIRIRRGLAEMNATLARMPEECSDDVYFNTVRPYIFGFDNVDYEGCLGRMSFRGETGAQSSCIPAIQIALGVQHKTSLLTDHLFDMRKYMPKPHRDWLTELENAWVREKQMSLRDMAKKFPELKEPYNACVEGLISFRKQHLEYAVGYIEKKVTDTKGTGGTPYINWLSELVRETEEFYL